MKKPKIKPEVMYMGYVRDVGFLPWVWSFSRKLAFKRLRDEEKSEHKRCKQGWRVVKVEVREKR